MSKRKRKVRDKGVVSPPRNPLFNHPLMRKSHVHDKSGKAKRRADKVNFIKDWYSQSGINSLLSNKKFNHYNFLLAQG